MAEVYAVQLTDNIEVHVVETAFSVTVTLTGGYTLEGTLGWAYAIADRLGRHNIDARVQGARLDGVKEAVLTVSGRGYADRVVACVREVE